MSVAGSFDDEGNLDLATLVTNLNNELPEPKTIETATENNQNVFPVLVTAKYGKYEIDGKGKIEKISGIELSQSAITIIEGEEYTPITLTATLTGELMGKKVTWNSTNTNLVTVNNGKVNLAETLSGDSHTAEIEAIVTVDNEEYKNTCIVTYVETQVVGLAITKPVLANSKYELNLTTTGTNTTGEIEVQGKGILGGILELKSGDLSKISITTQDNRTTYVSVGDVTLSGTKAKSELTAQGDTEASTPENITVKFNGTDVGNVEVTVETPKPLATEALVLTGTNSPYVNYTDGNGTTRLCRVLYNDATHGLQIITNSSVENVRLGSSDPNYTTGTALQKAQNSYNNAIVNLNNKAESYNNASLSYDARCVGSIATVTNDILANKDDETPTQTNGHKGEDTHYEEDYNTMEELNLNTEDCWLASRVVIGKYFEVRRIFSKTLSGSYLFTSTGKSDLPIYGFRPVFLLKSNVKVSGGEGTSGSPYILEAGN